MRPPQMTLLKERKLADLIAPPKGSTVLEASGVIAKGGLFYVIFDNIRRVARIHPSLSPASKRHGWFGRRRNGEGYEDIAYSPHLKRFYMLIEAEKHIDGSYKALIDECDEAGAFKGRRWVDFSFKKRNTGFEGLFAVRWKGSNYLLALCEGNRCRAGRQGCVGGGGRIHVLARKGAMWVPVARIKLPRTLDFEDYSAVSLRGDRIAVISQVTSQLWIGRLRCSDWTVSPAQDRPVHPLVLAAGSPASLGRAREVRATRTGNHRFAAHVGAVLDGNARRGQIAFDVRARAQRDPVLRDQRSVHGARYDDPRGGNLGGHMRAGLNRDEMAGGGNGAVHASRHHERLVRRNFTCDDDRWSDVRALLHETPPTNE